MNQLNEKKFIVIVGDGMADRPIASLGNKTPLEYAHIPNLDFLATQGVFGLARTVPVGVNPGSDTANLSIFGYNPIKAYTGRAPLEALNMGIDFGEHDVAFRCNIVTLKDGLMKDFTADHIDSRLSEVIMRELDAALGYEGIEFHPGVSYRNILMWRNYPHKEIASATPPHDITGKPYDVSLPCGAGSALLNEIMTRSAAVIASNDKIRKACEKYQGDPVSVWLWGGGFRPVVEPVSRLFGLRGCTISAVDLIHGIGRAAGLEPLHVEGATGYLDTNYEGKAAAAIDFLAHKGNFVFVHVESPDEAGHEGNIEHKLQAIEDFDRRTVGPLIRGSEHFADCTILCMPDHPTPIEIKTHSSDPVPFAFYRKQGFEAPAHTKALAYSEREAEHTGIFIDDASVLLGSLVKGSL
jgi:2,3-bisphosphoglycerate-independent phosphoglycerate mutase